MSMIRRNRILRKSASVRRMVQETMLKPSDFIVPVFITVGENMKDEISSMPGYYRFFMAPSAMRWIVLPVLVIRIRIK